MPTSSLAVKRRSVRNAPFFQLALTSLLAAFAALTWHLYTTQYHHLRPSSSTMTSSSSHTGSQPTVQPAAAAQDTNLPTSSAVHLAINTTTAAAATATLPLRLITYNVRYANSHPVRGEQPWSVRGPKLATQLRFLTEGHASAFLCLQECLHAQVLDLAARLGPSWAHVGRGRDAHPSAGEFSPIFYRADAWACARSETRWLSPTPRFAHRETGTRVVVMSTHFDHRGVRAREESARLLLEIAREWGSRGGDGGQAPAAVLLGGDFNSQPDDRAYRVMVAEGSGMSDVADLVPPEDRYGNELTYTSFGEAGPGEVPQRIDFLFIQEPHAAVIKSFGVLENMFDDGVRISDHRPVVADMNIPI
ncbi:endonuclease/exonuclease/phosphatase [Cordyceps fumosorosea ARSEF 2679]|uniref:Endonuclease/exonuclease/phosphatase n=1 Tax=Cordyceps fumosorosea (strain ARSEF 2679) TaxID=1081104 RepID=A0A167YCE0_CORFA|nr:endonuclease/exonuclease/phosphatase [Cordyceps fumosorosea ARSEF 2679]OAA66157.1 endonuclease/exonuclease/phosphatase [Cordyceps fumosorosea ARSEF 2679]